MKNDTNSFISASVELQDNHILENYGLNEINFESIKDYREKFAASKPQHPWNNLDTKEFLYKIGAWGKHRNTNVEGLTVAGLLMFSEERIITEVLPQYFLEYRQTLSNIVKGEWEKRFTSQDGTWSGNVYDFYYKTMTYLDESFSAASQSLPHSLLHEALMNAIVHADYTGQSGIVIERETEYIQMTNPGLLLISEEQAFTTNMSHLRNPTLFKMFVLLDLCKRAGSGLKSIANATQSFNEMSPTLHQHPESEQTILSIHLVSSSERHPIKEQPTKEQKTTNIGVDVSGNNEKHNSYIKKHNSYNKEVNSYNKVNKSYNSLENSFNKEVNYYNRTDKSYNKIGDTTEKKSNREEIQTEASESEELILLAKVARERRRLPPKQMEEIILQLCEKKPLRLKDLSMLLERIPDGLRNNYLSKLVNEGKLQLMYPDQPNHPKQSYITVDK
ncbi:ATP-binding protein [Priestia koreensis]|uniref:Uncharacterized protein n=1 Tax=Priestia koreensis TaxID=284581 RepID=A0A0M0KQM7_9BACI|nr:ATP-binding protein [Priestia koreensis]KOO41114.1 hypothetical protein AMD01_19395 [Priestia koreensis]